MFLVNSRAFGNAVVHEDYLAAASVVRCRKKHTVGVDVADTVGLEVCDNDYLSSDKLIGSVFFLDRGHYHSLTKSIVKSELETRVRLTNALCLKNLTYSEVKLCKIVYLDLIISSRTEERDVRL